MISFGNRAVLALFATAAVAGSAGAQQQAAKECALVSGSLDKSSVAMEIAVQNAQKAGTPADAQKLLSSAVKMATTNKDASAPARAWALGRALSLWMSQPDIGYTAARGKLGFTANTDAVADLPTLIDSSFTVVEQAMPECEANTAAWRAQKSWLKMVNDAIELSNAGKTDTAVTLAKRSLVLYRKAPYAYMVLGQIAARSNDVAGALNYWDQTVQMAQDTIYNDVRRSTLLNIAQASADAADSATVAATKATLYGKARDAYNALLADQGAKEFQQSAQQGLARLALAQGDTAALKATYKDQLANPSAYDYNALMQAAVTAANSEQVGDAIKLFEAAYQKNPQHRDVLYNLALLHIKAEQFEQANPIIQKLVTVDPSNGDDYRLYAFSYAGIAKRLNARARDLGKRANATKVAKVKKALIDSATVVGDSIPKITDLAVRYNNTADTLPVQVQFTEFNTIGSPIKLGGHITNKGKAEKTYAFVVEFVDVNGNVVDTQTANVGPVAPGAAGNFSLSTKAPNVVAFRYKPLQ